MSCLRMIERYIVTKDPEKRRFLTERKTSSHGIRKIKHWINWLKRKIKYIMTAKVTRADGKANNIFFSNSLFIHFVSQTASTCVRHLVYFHSRSRFAMPFLKGMIFCMWVPCEGFIQQTLGRLWENRRKWPFRQKVHNLQGEIVIKRSL